MSLDLQALLGSDADSLLGHSAKAFPSDGLVLPGPDYLSRVFSESDRSPTVLRNLGALFNHGRLGGTGEAWIDRSEERDPSREPWGAMGAGPHCRTARAGAR